MFIRPPRSAGSYRDRDLDCQDAIEDDFLAEVRGGGTAYVDLVKIRALIATHALAVGWTNDDVDDALQELVRCYVLRVEPVKRGSATVSNGFR
jgi:hypothetical protein